MSPKPVRLLAAALSTALIVPSFAEVTPEDLVDPTWTYLIAGVSFEQLIINGYAATDTNEPYLIDSVDGLYTDVNTQGDYSYVLAAGGSFTPRVRCYWDGTNGSAAWNTESEFQSAGGIGGWRVETEVGETIETTRRLPGGDRPGEGMDSQTGAIANLPLFDQASLGMTVLSGSQVSFVVDTSDYVLTTIKLAGGMQAGATSGSITWSYTTTSGAGMIGTTNFTDVFTDFTLDVGSIFTGGEIITVVATVSGSDGDLMALDSVQFIGTVPQSGTPPTLSGTPPSPVNVGAPYTATFAVTGSPAPTLSVASGQLPPGLNLSGLTLSGTPNTAGEYAFTIRASNQVPPSAEQSYTVIVNGPVTIGYIPAQPTLPAGLLGTAFEPYAFRVGGYPSATVTVSAGAVPSGMAVSNTGVLSGTPTEMGAFSFSLTASNGLSSATLANINLVVNGPPNISLPAGLVGRRNQPYSASFATTGFPAPVSTLTGTLPPGLTFASGTISGTPTAVGVYPLTLTATNAVGIDSEDFAIEIQDVPVYVPPSGGSLSFITGTPSAPSVSISGFPAPMVDVDSIQGAPAWMTISSSQNTMSGITTLTFAGTPPAGSEGVSIVTFTAENATGSVDGSVTIEVVGTSAAPVITSQPVGASAASGETVTLTVGATGQPSPGYQWRRGGVALPGATTATLVLANIQTEQAGVYDVVVTNVAGSVTSVAVTVAVVDTIRIVTQPVGVDAGVGQAISLSVIAEGSPPISYQWRKNGTAISGATSTNYAIASAKLTDGGDYTVVVGNATGTVTSNIATVRVEGAPTIVTQPAGATVPAGAEAVLLVVANSISAMTYQWEKDGEPVEGAVGSSLVVNPAQAEDSGSYRVVVANAWGETSSLAVNLTVVGTPEISRQPVSRFVPLAESVTFDVEVSQAAQATFQWLRDGVEIAGARSSRLTIAAVSEADAEARFQCRVSNAAGTVLSADGRITVFDPAQKEVSAGGETYDVSVWTGAGGPSWSAIGSAEWFTAARITESDVVVARVVVAATEADGVERSGTIELRRTGYVSGTHTVRQAERSLVESDFDQAVGPNGPWVPTGSGTVAVLDEAKGRTDVLAWQSGSEAGSTALAAGSLADPTASRAVAYARDASPGSTALRLQSDVYLEITDAAGGDAEVSVGLTDNASRDTPGNPSADTGLGMSIWHGGPGAGAQAGHTWITAHYRDAAGAVRRLNLAASVPADELQNRWVRLRIEIAEDRMASFWVDPEPFGDPLCIWRPVTSVRADVLEGQRVILSLAAVDETNRPYLHMPQALDGILPRPSAARLVNLSTRTFVGTDDQVAIAGMSLSGEVLQLPELLIRAVGPGLSSLGVGAVLPQPRMVVHAEHETDITLRIQGTWEQHRDPVSMIPRIRAFESTVGAFPLADGAADSAWIYNESESPGRLRPRTIVVSGVDKGQTGTALLEIYARGGGVGELVNLSTRGYVPAGQPMISGFVLDGDASRLVLVRAAGPALSGLGVEQPLAATSLSVYRRQARLAVNSGWSSSAGAAIASSAGGVAGAFPFASGSGDSALVLRLPPGLYTGVLTEASGAQAGTALVEVYLLPAVTDLDSEVVPGL